MGDVNGFAESVYNSLITFNSTCKINNPQPQFVVMYGASEVTNVPTLTNASNSVNCDERVKLCQL